MSYLFRNLIIVLVTLMTLSKVIIASDEKESTVSDLSPTFFSIKDNYATIQELDAVFHYRTNNYQPY